jgi:hypothetical protein
MGCFDEASILDTRKRRARPAFLRTAVHLGLLVCSLALAANTALVLLDASVRTSVKPPQNAQALRAKCAALGRMPGPPSGFHERARSERFEEGTSAVLITNATIFTGKPFLYVHMH